MASARKTKKVSNMGICPEVSEASRSLADLSRAESVTGAAAAGEPTAAGAAHNRGDPAARVEPETPETGASAAAEAPVRDGGRGAEPSAKSARVAAAPSRRLGNTNPSNTNPGEKAEAPPVVTTAGATPDAAPPKAAAARKAEPAAPCVADAGGARPKNPSKLAEAVVPAARGPIVNDRKPVTKKIEKTVVTDPAAASSSTPAALPAPAASVAASAVVAGTSSKPVAVRGPAVKATNVAEAAAAVEVPAKPAMPRPAERVAPAGSKTGKVSSAARLGFKPQEFIVYPAHGVGQIVTIEEQEVAGFKLELFVISFIKDKMILKVPTSKAAVVGMRKLAEADVVKKAFDTLCGRARVKRTMWSRRAQEYEAKINSGDLVAIAEVVRDLFRSDTQPEQSYSERQLYEAALDRMTREIVAVQKLTETEAQRAIEAQLMKGPRRGKAEEVEPDEPEIEEAA